VPLLLPPVEQVGAAEAVVARLDGLVISGGADVDPGRYGAEPHPRSAGWRPDRDEWEAALLDAAEAAGLPVLGVCRGMQVMAVHAGGTLVQHVPDLVGHEDHSPGGDRFGAVRVRTEPGSRLAALVGDEVAVSCHHHQAVGSHPGFEPAARAADGTLEAMEAPGDRFCVGVQWHPETAADVGLLAGLVRAAAAHADRRGDDRSPVGR
jgi:putative glutamine amidotransferase